MTLDDEICVYHECDKPSCDGYNAECREYETLRGLIQYKILASEYKQTLDAFIDLFKAHRPYITDELIRLRDTMRGKKQ